MRFAGVRSLADAAWATARRFPLPLLCAATATACALWAVDAAEWDGLPLRGLLAALLGLPLTLAATLVWERAAGDQRARPYALAALLAALGAVVTFFVASSSWTWVGSWTRFLHLAFAGHLLVAVLTFLGPGQALSFWSFNRALLLRFLCAALLVLVLFGGAALAFRGADELLGFDVDPDAYASVLAIAVLLLHPWLFLAGVPRAGELPGDDGVPPGLRVLAQLVLVPLAAISLLLLDGYVVRLLVERHWPVRSLGSFVAAAATVGLLALLLLYPQRAKPEYRWTDRFERAFHLLVLPPAIVLLVALARRVQQHGLTERRYLLAMLALWLVGLSLFQLATRSRNPKLVPISLALLALLTFGGPWSAYTTSRWDQRQRLVALLEANELLDGDRAVAATTTPSLEARRALSSTVAYLLEAHGSQALSPWLDAAVAAADDGSTNQRRPAGAQALAVRVLREIGIEYVDGSDGRARPLRAS